MCQKLCQMKIDQSPNCQYVMDFYKTLCEYGKEFTEKEFTTIYKNMKDLKLLNEDSIR